MHSFKYNLDASGDVTEKMYINTQTFLDEKYNKKVGGDKKHVSTYSEKPPSV